MTITKITGAISPMSEAEKINELVDGVNAAAVAADLPDNYVTKSTAQTISAEKTFSVSPQVITPTAGDSSTNAANTRFVANAIASKQDIISDLATIRSGATAGATAVQPADLDTLLATLYPVGSIYIGTQSTCPLATLISGSTWVLVAQDKALWGGDGTNANTTIAAGLPNITGKTTNGASTANAEGSGAISTTSQTVYKIAGGNFNCRDIDFDASRSSSIYGNSNTVQPPAYVVNIWRRIS